MGHILAFDKGVPLLNTLVWGQPFEYRHEVYIFENKVFGYISGADNMGLPLASLT